MEQPVQQTDIENSEGTNVIHLHPPAPRPRRVPPLTDQEIIALRQMLQQFSRMQAEFGVIKTECPLAARALSTRT